MEARFFDELGSGSGWGLGWIAAEPAFMQRASHALADDGRVWLVDPVDVDGLDERVAALGRPVGVLRLLDRHGRDGEVLAERYGVPFLAPRPGPIEGSPFEAVRTVGAPGWREVALWWPERRVLVVADALGTAPYFLASGERLAVHPFLRLLPPRSLGRLEPEHVLCGHGVGIHEDAAAALHEALGTSRRRVPRWLAGLVLHRR